MLSVFFCFFCSLLHNLKQVHSLCLLLTLHITDREATSSQLLKLIKLGNWWHHVFIIVLFILQFTIPVCNLCHSPPSFLLFVILPFHADWPYADDSRLGSRLAPGSFPQGSYFLANAARYLLWRPGSSFVWLHKVLWDVCLWSDLALSRSNVID